MSHKDVSGAYNLCEGLVPACGALCPGCALPSPCSASPCPHTCDHHLMRRPTLLAQRTRGLTGCGGPARCVLWCCTVSARGMQPEREEGR